MVRVCCQSINPPFLPLNHSLLSVNPVLFPLKHLLLPFIYSARTTYKQVGIFDAVEFCIQLINEKVL